MAVTLVDAAYASNDPFAPGIAKIFVENSPIMKYIPWVGIEGDAHKYRQEDALPTVSHRPVNSSYTENTGRLTAMVEPLSIVGGEVYIDNFFYATQRRSAGSLEHQAVQYEMKARALSREVSRVFFEGDPLVNAAEPEGMRARLGGNQVINASTAGTSITIDLVDQLLDSVPFDNVHLFMNRTVRRKLTTQMRAIGGTGGSLMVTYSDMDQLGKQVSAYAGVPIHVVEDMGNGDTLLGFDEDPGDGTADTTSVYAVSFGENRVYGIYAGEGPPIRVDAMGEMETKPGRLGRIEFFYGFVMKHPRAVARLRGILAA